MNKENKLTPDQEKELIMLATEIEAEAIAMKLDYDENPSDSSGSVVFINENSSLLDNEEEELGNQAVVSSTQLLKKQLEKQKEEK